MQTHQDPKAESTRVRAVRLPSSLDVELEERTAKDGITASVLLRQALEHYLHNGNGAA
jgi:hypothetical protein